MSGNYAFDLEIPLLTLASSPVDTELILSPGIIDEIAIGFPPGCSALARIQLLYENSVIFPANPESSYGWDDTIIEFNPRYELPETNALLVARCWNLDEFYNHTITVMINLIDKNPSELTFNAFMSLASKS